MVTTYSSSTSTTSSVTIIPTTVTNAAPTGQTYDGTASRDLYVVEPSGATAFDFPSPTGTGTDYIDIPSGAAIDDLQQLTLEFIVYYRDGNTGNWPFLWDKSPLPNRWYIRAADDLTDEWSYRLEYYMDCAGSSPFGNAYGYFTPSFSFIPGNFYYIQLTHDRSSVSNEPVIKMNNVTQDITQNVNGAPTALYDDTGFDMYLANCAEIQTCGLGVDLLLFRMYDVVLTDDELIANFDASGWRIGETNWTQVTVPSTTSNASAPSFIGSSVTWTQATTPSTTSDADKPSDYAGRQWSQTTTSSTISGATVPNILTGWLQVGVPTTTSATFAPTVVGLSIVWVQTIVPSTSSSSSTVIIQGLGIIERVNAVFPKEGYRTDGYTIPVITIEAKTDVTNTERILTAPPQAQEFRLVGNDAQAPRIPCKVSEGV